VQPLDPLTIPLHGSRLFEASAGTGKTYTLALLFLRLLLERQLEVDQILVVTFTRAATGELRGRIRKRLREALDFLEGRGQTDPQLAALLQTVPLELGKQRLADALVRMDEAAIYTIHGFCQRILQDHAFESGSMFDVTLLESETPLRLQIIEDFWRNRFYSASTGEATWAAATWKEPAGLLRVVGNATTAVPVTILPAVDTAQRSALEKESRDLFSKVQQLWPTAREEVRTILEQHPCLKRNEKAYRLHDQVPSLLASMDEMAAMGERPYHLPKGIDRLCSTTMADHCTKKCAAPPSHPFFTLFDAFYTCTRQFLQALTISVLHDARHYVQQELDRRKRRQGCLSFDDLLTRLATSLNQPRTGPLLATRIATRFPVALVDEFQDTDPVQYQLFSRVYRQQAGTLFMIGDPKQAIYSFRGADIFTYIRARRDTTPDNRYTMATNYRSTAAMVGAVNTLFASRQDAFIFNEDIAFHPAQAADSGKVHPLLLDANPITPLTTLILESDLLRNNRSPVISKERAAEAAVNYCADTIALLLEKGKTGKATIGDRPLAAGDIAILVRTHREAEAVQQGLRLRRLNSVYYSQSSVFATEEARQLALVLTALADLSDAARIRTCLATPLFGLHAEDLQALNSDEQAWGVQLTTLLRYQHLWRDQGFIPLFQLIFAEQQVTRRLSAQPGGERSLTNYLHLAELLQESPANQHGMTGLVRWFRQQMHAPDNNAANQLIRLENDEQLIRIVTIHRSKGLEFPVVFLPFLWHGRSLSPDQPVTFHDRRSLQMTVDLGTGAEEHRRWAEEEQLAEDLRLLYVAITRAQYCCLFCWGRVKGLEQTALAHLLHQGQLPADDTDLQRDLEQLNKMKRVLTLQPGSGISSAAPRTANLAPPLLQLQSFQGRINPGWSLTSYSRLTATGDSPPTDTDRDEPDRYQPMEPEDFTSVFTFPRGPAAGTCLHTVLERLDFNQPVNEQQSLVAELLEQAGIDPRWLPATVRWLDDLLRVALPGSCPLNQVAAGDRINELSFLFPLEQVQMRRLNTLLAASGLQPLSATGGLLQGLMKGFIDLVFRFQGRYYIVDYKSNHLGASLQHYGPEALRQSMDDHQYHLQYLIYTLALHRFLQIRLADYQYETHFGGVYYLFLRAMHPDHPPGTGIHAARPEYTRIAELDACCRGREARP
jgi:exodeoxyribonuclease V beta subunit